MKCLRNLFSLFPPSEKCSSDFPKGRSVWKSNGTIMNAIINSNKSMFLTFSGKNNGKKGMTKNLRFLLNAIAKKKQDIFQLNFQ